MVSIIAIDLAKNVFQLVGVNDRIQVAFEHRFRRAKFESFMTHHPPCVVVMEACFMAHYWGRRFQAMGHEVRLIPPQHVKPFVRGNKTDRNDALAIAEASRRPKLKFVAVKSVEQQQTLALHRIRERLKQQRTQLMNQTRALLAEFGLVMSKGHKAFREGLIHAIDTEQPTPAFTVILQQAYDEYQQINQRMTVIEQHIERVIERSPEAEILLSVPGIGPLTASAFIATVDRGQAFNSPREFAVWLGLTPKTESSGDKKRLGHITKRGDTYLRALLIQGANAALRWTKKRKDRFSRWANALLARRGRPIAIVAVAHKMARVAWTLLQRQTPFQAQAI